jgi:hypothetical protein
MEKRLCDLLGAELEVNGEDEEIILSCATDIDGE